MYKLFYSCFLILGMQFKANAQIVKFIKNPIEAKYRVFISDKKQGATHFIYKVKNPTEIRKAGEWYVVTNPQLFKNAMTLYEVKTMGEADFIVHYVTNRDSARIVY